MPPSSSSTSSFELTAAFAAPPVPAPGIAWRDYLALTKPRIMSLLLLTGVCGMFVGAQGVPPLGDLTVLVVGLALACGGASALNHVLDRDLDRQMERTAGHVHA